MFRAIIEVVITILVAIVARAILTSLFKAGANALRNGVAQGGARYSEPPANKDARGSASPGGNLHKDPVCGTYVAESTPFRRNISGQSFYYCSETCLEKHALAAR